MTETVAVNASTSQLSGCVPTAPASAVAIHARLKRCSARHRPPMSFCGRRARSSGCGRAPRQLPFRALGTKRKHPAGVAAASRSRRGRIVVSPLLALPEPVHLVGLKGELAERWPMTSPLDILKEADLRVGITPHFASRSAHEALEPETLQRRLLLCLDGALNSALATWKASTRASRSLTATDHGRSLASPKGVVHPPALPTGC